MPVTIGGSGPITGVTSINTSVSDTELGYLDGVTSAIQSQINTAGGLVKITDQSFSAASSVSVNNCFSSTYQNYRIVVSATLSAISDLRLRLRVSGSDNTTTNYAYQATMLETAATFNRNGGATFFLISNSGDTVKVFGSFDVLQPNESAITSMTGVSFVRIMNTVFGAEFNATTVFDGFTIYPNTGNITGTIRVYGYRN